MNIEQLNDQAETIEQDRMPCLQVKATLTLAEQVKRVADLLESVVSKDITDRKSLDVFVEMNR